MAKVTVVDLKRVKTAKFDGSEWFSRENKRFFNDISYKVMMGRKSHKLYLVRRTYGWLNRAVAHWCINYISDALEVGNLVERTEGDYLHKRMPE
jgi:hypothetical protein